MKNKMRSILAVVALVSLSFGGYSQKFDKTLQMYCESVITETNTIVESRKPILEQIAGQILSDMKKYKISKPMFICTHNSRRSQMAQLWLHTAADFYGLENVFPYSGGTESTQFHANAVKALQKAGFTFTPTQNFTDQQSYVVKSGRENVERFMCSKKFGSSINPQKEYFAVMVCSEADKSCPTVQGADARFSLPYDDPRYFDGTPSAEVKYDETCRLIAKEMFYIMDIVMKQLNIEAEKNK